MDPTALMALARHGEEIATVRTFQARANAIRVVLLIHTPQGETAMIECDEDATVEVTEGDVTAVIPTDAPIPAVARTLPDIRPTPASAIHSDTGRGQLAAPLCTIDHLAEITLALARTFGGLTVATAEFATHDPDLPITFAAREGEPVVLAAGDEQYEL